MNREFSLREERMNQYFANPNLSVLAIRALPRNENSVKRGRLFFPPSLSHQIRVNEAVAVVSFSSSSDQVCLFSLFFISYDCFPLLFSLVWSVD